MTRTRALLCLPLAALAISACNGGGKDAPGPSAGRVTSTTVTSTTETSVPTTTTTTTAGVPGAVVIPDTSGDDFAAVAAGLNELQNLVYEHPDRPDLLDTIFEPGGSARHSTEVQISNLRTKGYRYTDEGATIRDVQLQQRPSPDVVLISQVSTQGPQVVVDASGNVAGRGDGWKPRKEQYTLKRGADGRWRIITMTVNGPA